MISRGWPVARPPDPDSHRCGDTCPPQLVLITSRKAACRGLFRRRSHCRPRRRVPGPHLPRVAWQSRRRVRSARHRGWRSSLRSAVRPNVLAATKHGLACGARRWARADAADSKTTRFGAALLVRHAAAVVFEKRLTAIGVFTSVRMPVTDHDVNRRSFRHGPF